MTQNRRHSPINKLQFNRILIPITATAKMRPRAPMCAHVRPVRPQCAPSAPTCAHRLKNDKLVLDLEMNHLSGNFQIYKSFFTLNSNSFWVHPHAHRLKNDKVVTKLEKIFRMYKSFCTLNTNLSALTCAHRY